MASLKRFLVIFAIGGFVGTLVVGYLAPKILGWYWETPMDIGVSCKPALTWGVARFQTLQLAGVIVGGGINVALFLSVFRSKLAP